ncbi:MAG TPA: Gfo/Idh/MocA family oxidoreductase [Verrucomicrobiota bacterium]|nr:Gfo/Idh/MocA family oxidoreductase [Verrucomicrobiota bacterium]
MKAHCTRRQFLVGATTSALPFFLSTRRGFVTAAAANEELNLALVGVGGRGEWFVGALPAMRTRFVALCDTHAYRLNRAGEKFPEAKRYRDFRRMLDESADRLDGVVVATPDHNHAVISARALRAGKPVFCEKPLTRTISEARALRELAASTKLATQMGNQGTSSDAFRRSVEVIQSGALGEIREVLAWNESGGGGPHPRPTTSEAVPEELDWDVWLGPAAARPYHREWANWHRWRDFATGQLGNWAVHSTNLAFKAFRLDEFWKSTPADLPEGGHFRVSAKMSEVLTDTLPKWELIEFTAPRRGNQPAFTMVWCNGRAPGGRERIEESLGRKLDWGDAGDRKWNDYAGLLIVGARGMLHSTGHNMTFSLLPEADFKDLLGPPRSLPRSPGHEREWLDAIRGGAAACSNFADYGSLLTEWLLLGNVATQTEGAIEYDPHTGRVVNNESANRLCKAIYREGWTL